MNRSSSKLEAGMDRYKTQVQEETRILSGDMNEQDDHYKPIKFALNRAVFHGELTEAEADAGIAEYEALLALARKSGEILPRTAENGATGSQKRSTGVLEVLKNDRHG